MRARALSLALTAMTAAVMLLIVLPVSRHDAAAAAPAYPAHSVLPVLFVPAAGDPEAPAEAAALQAGLDEVRRWYGEQLGRTFVLDEVEVVRAEGPPGRYGIRPGAAEPGPALFDAVKDELGRRGYPVDPAAGLTTIAFVKGAGGFAAGAAFSGGAPGGFALLGDNAIDSLQGEIAEESWPRWWTGKRRQLGAVAHELGHTWGLRHPGPGGDGHGYDGLVMGAWWDYPAVGFGPSERAELLVHGAPFFRDPAGAVAR
jgi:hypothetical protein